MNYKNVLKKEKGITLVALIITVILMLILAGVAVSVLTEDGGLFGKSKNAAELYGKASEDENKQLSNLMNRVDKYLSELEIAEDNPKVKAEATIGIVVRENQTYDGRLKGEYNNPIIPKGFAPINQNDAIWGTATGYQKGLVITDNPTMNETTGTSIGNEFVWVPVSKGDDGTNITFSRQNWYKVDGITLNGAAMGVETEETSEGITIMQNNIETNGGFFIARYEAGTKSDNKVVSKQGVTPLGNINWSTARSEAEAMYSIENNNYNVVSKLIYGTCWDTALNFIGSYGGEVEYTNFSNDTVNFGNYGNKNVCGSSINTAADAYRQKNIYDISGNMWEYTMEQGTETNRRFCRGGGAGDHYPASQRSNNTITDTANTIGFRIVLYIE